MLTVIASGNGGIFTPALRKVERGAAEIFFAKNRPALKKLKKFGVKTAVIAPSARKFTRGEEQRIEIGAKSFFALLPRALASRTELPLDELFISAPLEDAAAIVELCADCARLFTVISPREPTGDLFDSLYYNKGIILRRISAPGSRVGQKAFSITDGGRTPLGVEKIGLSELCRIRLFGELDSLCELGLSPTAELYAFAGLPFPQGEVGKELGGEFFYLDTGIIL